MLEALATDCVNLAMNLQVCPTDGIPVQVVASFSQTHLECLV